MKSGSKRELIVRRAAKELRDGYYVNLGIGMFRAGETEASSKPSLACGCCRSTPTLGALRINVNEPEDFVCNNSSYTSAISVSSKTDYGRRI